MYGNMKPNVWQTGPSSMANTSYNSNDTKFGLDNKSGTQLEQIGLDATSTLDATQRKTLPAWIR